MENGKSRLQQAQQDVEEVRVIMLDNMKKADERSGKLGDLEERADQLHEKSKEFEKTSRTLKQKKKWENQKVKIVLIIAGASLAVVVVALIIYGIVTSVQGQ